MNKCIKVIKKVTQENVIDLPRFCDLHTPCPTAKQRPSKETTSGRSGDNDLDIGTEKDSIHQLDWVAQVTIYRLRTGHCQLSPTSTDWKFPIQTNVHAAQVLKTPTASCSSAPPSTLWDTRHGPVRWMTTGSFGDRLRHCGRLPTSTYRTDLAWPGTKKKKEFLTKIWTTRPPRFLACEVPLCATRLLSRFPRRKWSKATRLDSFSYAISSISSV